MRQTHQEPGWAEGSSTAAGVSVPRAVARCSVHSPGQQRCAPVRHEPARPASVPADRQRELTAMTPNVPTRYCRRALQRYKKRQDPATEHPAPRTSKSRAAMSQAAAQSVRRPGTQPRRCAVTRSGAKVQVRRRWSAAAPCLVQRPSSRSRTIRRRGGPGVTHRGDRVPCRRISRCRPSGRVPWRGVAQKGLLSSK